MTNIRLLLNRLSANLGTIREMISIENSVNDQSLNLLLETKMLEILNITFGYNLINANLIDKNHAGIDGIDKDNKIIVQVSSSVNPEKITHTVNQVLKKELFLDFDRLIFIALNTKKKLTESFKKGLLKKIDGKFQFDLATDILDLRDIYRIHHSKQDLQKIHSIVKLLDEILEYVPRHKESGFDSISICFHDEEVENVFSLVETIIREGINVYISSKKLYNRFSEVNHPFRDFIIYANPEQSFQHIPFCITVLSNTFIKQNFAEQISYSCHLLQHALDNEIKIEVITFDRFVNRIKLEHDSRFKSYSTVQKDNILPTVKKILSNRIKEASFGDIRIEDIKQELINTNKNFNVLGVDDNTDYSLLNLKMSDQDNIEFNYMILTKDFKLNTTINHFDKNFKKNYSKNLNVLVPKDFSHKTRRRLEGFRALSNKIFYIDEHLFDKRYKTFIQEPILNTEDFISPVVKHDGQHLGINDIIHWIINNPDSSVAIIKGSGGIGKTTVCEKIHDMLLEDHERTIVIFIDAAQYIDVFKRKRSGNNVEAEYDLYNIFKACHPHANIIDKNSFYVNYSLGNIIIVFDGIDEIISTIPSFSLRKFLATLEALKLIIGKGKILINCRDVYVSDLIKLYNNETNNLQIYELLPFDEDLASKFFLKHFDKKELVRHCLKLAKEFFPDSKDGGSYKYPPFILEIILHIVDQDFDYREINADLNSPLLQFNEVFDTIVFKICNREIIKKEKNGFQLDINSQIRFLCYLAIEEKGEIETENFTHILSKIGVHDRVNEVAKGLQDHPLIVNTGENDSHKFRFDFFKTNFKALGILNLLNAQIDLPISKTFINTIAFECNFNSVISKIIIDKLSTVKVNMESLIANAKIIISKAIEISKQENGQIGSVQKKFVSNIFLLILKVAEQKGLDNNEIITSLFGDANQHIQNFYFMDIPQDSGIVLNLSNLYLSNSEINNFPNFFHSEANGDTYFDDSCTIDNVFINKINSKPFKLAIKNFDKNIKGDNSIFRILSLQNNPEIDLKRYFKEYLKSFYNMRQFKTEVFEKAVNIIEDDFVTLDLLTKILNYHNIIIEVENSLVIINERLKFKIIKFLSQGILFTELSRSITELKRVMMEGKRPQI
jgi:hypothetical protein